jgi:hypothetical protein
MRTFILLAFCAIGACAQDSTISLSEGATLAVRLDRAVSAAHAHPGDPVEATLLAPVLARGIVLIPTNAKITGHALAVEGRRNGGPSRLLIRFEEARWGGEAVTLNAYIVRQLATRRTVRKANTDTACPEASGFQAPRRRGTALDPTTLPQVPKFEPPPCYDRVTRGIGAVDERIVFVSPPLKNMQLQRVSQPRGATALVSNKKNVELARGIMLELRQAEP